MNTEMRRRLFTPIVRGLLVCLLGSSGFTAAAEITEVDEPPNIWSNPQRVQVPSEGLTISARMGKVDGDWSADVDFFAFEAAEGDTLSIEIKDALKPDGAGTCVGFPSNIALYDPAIGSPLVSGMADCETLIEASIPRTAMAGPGRRTYIVGVSAWRRTFLDDGEVDSADMDTPGGTYRLVINGVTSPTAPPPAEQPPVEQPPAEQPPAEQPPVTQPPVTQPPVTQPPATQPPATQPPATQPPAATKYVPIVVRHWHQDERDLERRRGRDPIVVAILSVRGFRATQEVDPNSLTFGATGYEKSLFRCRKPGKDINKDGRTDMVCYFKPDVANFQTGDLNGKLEGKTVSGQRIKGVGALRIFSVPRERHGFKHHGERHRDDRKNNNGNRNR